MSLVDYSSMEEEIKGAQAPKILPSSTQTELRIIAVNTGNSEKNSGCKYYQVVFDVPAEPMVKDFNTFFWDPIDAKNKVADKQVQRNMYTLKEFFTAFNVDLSKPFSWEDNLVGRTGWAILGIQKDDVYGDKNTVKKFVHGPGGPSGNSTHLGDPYAITDNDTPF